MIPALLILAALPLDAPVDREEPVRASYIAPALEVLAFESGLMAFNNQVTQMPFALVTPDSVASHFDGRADWRFDVDYFVTNQFGHPYQGAVMHAFARSAGVPFWQSCLYPAFGSLLWEYFGERDAPSINDQITTTLGGIFLGEAMHRSYRYLITRYPDNLPVNLAAVLVSPPSAINRWLFDDQPHSADVDHLPPVFAEVRPGISLATRLVDRTNGERRPISQEGLQAAIAAEVSYGAPGDPRWRYQHPFSAFDVSARFTWPGVPTANLYIRGLLIGDQFGMAESRVRGMFGVFGLYDFGANNIVRVSSVGVGPGTSLQAQLSERMYLRTTVVFAGLGFAAAGSLGIDTERYRDYHIGPGLETIADVRLIRVGTGMLALRAQTWSLTGFYAEPYDGFEQIDYVDLEARVRLTKQLALVLEAPVSLRQFGFGDSGSSTIVGSGPRLSLSYTTDDSFGIVH